MSTSDKAQSENIPTSSLESLRLSADSDKSPGKTGQSRKTDTASEDRKKKSPRKSAANASLTESKTEPVRGPSPSPSRSPSARTRRHSPRHALSPEAASEQRGASPRRSPRKHVVSASDEGKARAMRTGLVYDERMLLHSANYAHVESPARIAVAFEVLLAAMWCVLCFNVIDLFCVHTVCALLPCDCAETEENGPGRPLRARGVARAGHQRPGARHRTHARTHRKNRSHLYACCSSFIHALLLLVCCWWRDGVDCGAGQPRATTASPSPIAKARTTPPCTASACSSTRTPSPTRIRWFASDWVLFVFVFVLVLISPCWCRLRRVSRPAAALSWRTRSPRLVVLLFLGCGLLIVAAQVLTGKLDNGIALVRPPVYCPVLLWFFAVRRGVVR